MYTDFHSHKKTNHFLHTAHINKLILFRFKTQTSNNPPKQQAPSAEIQAMLYKSYGRSHRCGLEDRCSVQVCLKRPELTELRMSTALGIREQESRAACVRWGSRETVGAYRRDVVRFLGLTEDALLASSIRQTPLRLVVRGTKGKQGWAPFQARGTSVPLYSNLRRLHHSLFSMLVRRDCRIIQNLATGTS